MGKKKRSLLLLLSLFLFTGSSWSQAVYPPIISSNVIIAHPVCLQLSIPFHDDTLSYGDSLKLTYAIITTCAQPPQINDTLPVAWKLVPQFPYFNSRLRDSSGIENVFYAGNGYGQFLIIATAMDSAQAENYPDTVRVYVKLPPAKYGLWIEPDTNIDPNSITPQMLARLQYPHPVSLVSIPASGGIDTVAAVRRDQYGNFVGFPSNALWQVIGDTGIIRISTPTKPYLCMIEGLKYGDTYIRLSDDSGSTADTVQVRVLFFSSFERLSIIKALAKAKTISQYYNLRGQRVRGFGNSRIDGIVLERIIGPGGKASAKKKFLGPDSRKQTQE